MAAEWRGLQNQMLEGPETEQARLPSLEQIAIEGNRLDHYNQVYRLACEAAHVGDLFVYMPPQPEEPGLRLSDMSLMRAYVCLKFGIILACDMLHDASDSLAINLDRQLDDFRERRRAIVDMPPSTSDASPEMTKGQ